MFKSLETWNHSTKLHCWYCDLQFTGIPCFVPKSIESTINGEVINVDGCFCWFNCAMSYIEQSNLPTYIQIDRKNMLLKVYEKFTGKKINSIKHAPNKHEMQKYGGPVTEIEYRDKLYKLKIK